MSRPACFRILGRLVFLTLLAALFLAGMIGGAVNGRDLAEKIHAALHGRWEEKLAGSWDWAVTAGKRILNRVGGGIKEVLAPQRKDRFYFPVLSWEKQVTFPDRVGFVLPEKAEVYACAAGLAVEVVPRNGSWQIGLDHGGSWRSFYYPVAEPCIAQGRRVKAGEKLGRCAADAQGETNLFWEIWYGPEPLSPRYFLPATGK